MANEEVRSARARTMGPFGVLVGEMVDNAGEVLVGQSVNPEAPLARVGLGLPGRSQEAAEQAEKEAVRQQVERRLRGLGDEQVKERLTDKAYRMASETEMQRFCKTEALHQPAPASEVDTALVAVSESNKALDDAVLRLERRLGRLMRPEPEEKAPNACPMMASLPMEIMAGAAWTMDAVDRLKSILDRLVL